MASQRATLVDFIDNFFERELRTDADVRMAVRSLSKARQELFADLLSTFCMAWEPLQVEPKSTMHIGRSYAMMSRPDLLGKSSDTGLSHLDARRLIKLLIYLNRVTVWLPSISRDGNCKSYIAQLLAYLVPLREFISDGSLEIVPDNFYVATSGWLDPEEVALRAWQEAILERIDLPAQALDLAKRARTYDELHFNLIDTLSSGNISDAMHFHNELRKRVEQLTYRMSGEVTKATHIDSMRPELTRLLKEIFPMELAYPGVDLDDLRDEKPHLVRAINESIYFEPLGMLNEDISAQAAMGGNLLSCHSLMHKLVSGAPGDRQGVKGASPSQQRCSEPCCPRVMRWASRGAQRSVDRGTCRPAIEPRKKFDLGADAVRSAEGNTHGRAIASARATRRGRRPWHACTLFVREPGDLQSDRRRQSWPVARIGKVRSRRR